MWESMCKKHIFKTVFWMEKWLIFTCNNQITHSNTIFFFGSVPFCLPVSFMQQSIMSTYFNCLVLSLFQMGKFMYPSQSQQDIVQSLMSTIHKMFAHAILTLVTGHFLYIFWTVHMKEKAGYKEQRFEKNGFYS